MVPDDWQRERTDFRSAFEPGARLGYGRSVVTMAVRPIAEVELPTGELLIGDAGRRTAHRLARRAPPGRYRVEIAFARFEDGSTLDAAVRVVFAAAAPDRWAPGWQSGSGDGDPPTLAAAVARSGVAFFVDASHEAELRELLAQPGDLTPVLGPGVFFHVPVDEGDRGLPCWWALDKGEEPLELAVDFRLLLGRHFEHTSCPLPAEGAPLRHPLLESHGPSRMLAARKPRSSAVALPSTSPRRLARTSCRRTPWLPFALASPIPSQARR